MSDPNHLYEADKVRIQNEAKVRAAMENPNWVEEAYKEWREYWLIRRRERSGLTQLEHYQMQADYWSRKAFLAEGRELAMGRQIDKLGRRIGRQRKANREQLERLKQAEARIRELESE